TTTAQRQRRPPRNGYSGMETLIHQALRVGRCGLSTGPTTPEGKARTIKALKAGRRRWLAKLKSDGKPIPFGRGPQSIERRARTRRVRGAVSSRRSTYSSTNSG